MDLQKVVLARSPPERAHGLNKGRALDISDGASQLHDAHVGLLVGVVDGDLRDSLHPVLDGVGDVRDNLHRLAQVVPSSLTLDDVLVHLARGDVILAREGDVEVSLVVAQVEIDFAAVVEDKAFAVSGGRLALVVSWVRAIRRRTRAGTWCRHPHSCTGRS